MTKISLNGPNDIFNVQRMVKSYWPQLNTWPATPKLLIHSLPKFRSIKSKSHIFSVVLFLTMQTAWILPHHSAGISFTPTRVSVTECSSESFRLDWLKTVKFFICFPSLEQFSVKWQMAKYARLKVNWRSSTSHRKVAFEPTAKYMLSEVTLT